MKILRATPVLVVDRIEDQLPFYENALGYTRIAVVPHGDALGFAILEKDGLEVMLQTRASIAADTPAVLEQIERHGVVQFMEVDSLDAVLERLGSTPFLIPPRNTSYGMREVYVQDPAGYILGFAQKL